MAPNKISSAGDSHVSEDKNSPSTDARDQILLKALQGLIARVVDPKGINDISQTPLGPEAKKLIIALREFVTSIIETAEPTTRNTVIEVSLGKDEDALQNKGDIDDIYAGISDVRNNLWWQRHLATSVNPEPPFQDKLLKALRKHVFNMMPIRMLFFEPHGSSLKISLLERGAVHERLESALRSNIRKADHVPMISADSNGRMESDEKAIERVLSKYTKYAILSHTWLHTSAEVTYSNWTKGIFDTEDPGYQKLVNFCKMAWKDHGLRVGWMDTVCIDKESSSELDESIRSMYKWYNHASVCMIYLAETAMQHNMHLDRWFSRGWTLQELLAPRFIKFYNCDWKKFIDNPDVNDNTLTKITTQIELATTISKNELFSIHHACISRRMQLAAGREVTREEDMSYSLMGIFNVSFPTAYGEGAHRAFFRLLQEILASPEGVVDILNWAGDLPDSRPHASRILPSSPMHYLKSYRSQLPLWKPMEPLTLTHLGLRVPVLLMSAISIPYEASPYVPIGDFSGTVNISPVGFSMYAPSASYNVLDNRIFGQDGRKENGGYQLTLAVFNFTGTAASILVRKTCIAKVLYFNEAVGKVTSSTSFYAFETEEPVVFDLNNGTLANASSESDYTRIKRDDLAKNGMQLISLYL